MPGTFSAALSALGALGTAVDVVGNNLANLNTPGFKASAVSFRDLVTQSMGSGLGETQIGFGVAQPLTFRQFSQGSVQTTGGLMDTAIQGDGFFIVQDSAGRILYTRAGNFLTDKNGVLMTNTGARVQGWSAVDPSTGKLNTIGPPDDIVVPVGTLKPPTVTTDFSIDMNLDANAPIGAASLATAPMTVYDSLGNPHVLTLHFQKTAANTWAYGVNVPAVEVGGAAGDPPVELLATAPAPTMVFNPDGTLDTPADGAPITFTLGGAGDPFTDGAAALPLTWDPYTGLGIGRITQFGQPSALSSSSQNGSGAAQLIQVSLSNGGYVLAQYSNGDQVMVAQLALASIRNPDSLLAVGDNNYQLSARSAIPAVGVPGTGGRGSISGGALEASTVDIAREFTHLIVFERGYQANARVITTQDQLSQETINIIR